MSKRKGIKYLLISIFLKYPNSEIIPRDVAKKYNLKPQSVYTAFRTLRELGLIYHYKTRGNTKSFKAHIPKLREYLQKQLFKIDTPTRYPLFFRKFLDFNGAVFVGQTIHIELDNYQRDKLRNCKLLTGKSKKDRAKWLSYSTSDFTLSISKHGTLRINFKNPELGPLIKFFKDVIGLDEYNIQIILERIHDKIGDSSLEVEIPIKHSEVPKFTVETKLGDKYLVASVVKSHFPKGELEIKGTALMVQNFINAIAGVQHFSMIEYAILNETSKVNDNLNKTSNALIKGFEQMIKELKGQTEPQETEPTIKENGPLKKPPNYYI